MKKRILLITHLYYPAVGGAERVFQRIAEGLAGRGHEVSVLTSDALSTEQYFTAADNGLPGSEEVNGVRVRRAPLRTDIYRKLRLVDKLFKKLGRLGVFMRPLTFGPHFGRALSETLRRDFDAVIAGPAPTTATLYGLLYKLKRSRAKLVHFPHLHLKDRLHGSPLNIWALRRADMVFVDTEAEKEYLVRRRIRRERIRKVGSGVDSHLLEALPKGPSEALFEVPSGAEQGMTDYVLYLGQEGEHKRIPLLIKAMKSLWDKGCERPLVIAGSRTNFSPTLDRLIASMDPRHKEKVRRLNDISEAEKVRIIDGCFVLVNPSSYEAFGIVFLEAWARGKPVIGARIEALQEIIRHGHNGFLFKNKSAEDLEAKIAEVLADKEQAERIGRAGQAEVREKYIWPQIVGLVESYLVENCSRRLKPAHLYEDAG